MRCVGVGRTALLSRGPISSSSSSSSFFFSSRTLPIVHRRENINSSFLFSVAAAAGLGLANVGVCHGDEDSDPASEKFIQEEAERHYKEALEAAYRLKVLHIQNVEQFLSLEVEKSFQNSLAQKKAEKAREIDSNAVSQVESAIAHEAESLFEANSKKPSVVVNTSFVESVEKSIASEAEKQAHVQASETPSVKAEPPQESPPVVAVPEPVPVVVVPEPVHVVPQEVSHEHSHVSHEAPHDSSHLPSSAQVDEFEVFQKWKLYIENETQKQLKALEEAYEKKIKDLRDQFDDKVSEEIARQKEILSGRYQQKFRTEVDKSRAKLAADYQRRKDELEKDFEHRSLVLENEFLAKLEAEKEKHQAQLLQVESDMQKEVELLRSVIVHEHNTRLEKLKSLLQSQRDQELYHSKLSSHLTSLNHSVTLTLSTLSLLKQVNDGSPFAKALDEVKKNTSDSKVLALLDSVPENIATAGIPNLLTLQAQFAEVVESAFSDSLMGNNVSFETFVRSKIVSKFIHRKKGMVHGYTVEDRLARAEHYLSHGDLTNCISELDAITGPAEVTLSTWLKTAKERQRILSTVDAIESLVQLSMKFESKQ